MTEWNLFVDESGNFDDVDDHCVVAGVLVRSPLSAKALRKALRGAVRHAAPNVAYPPHTSHLNTGFGWLAAVVRADHTLPGLTYEVTRVADEFPNPKGATLWQRVVDDEYYKPSYDDYREMKLWLDEADGALNRAVAEEVRAQGRRFANALEDLPVTVQGDVFGLASHSPRGTIVGTAAHGKLVRDRYTDALEALLERVLFILRGAECEDQHVHLHVASRGVVRAQLRVILTPEDVEEIARAMVGSSPNAETDLGVRVCLYADATPRYNEGVHPGVVFADFFANRMRHVIDRSTSQTLKGLLNDVAKTCGLPVCMRSCAFPTEHALSAIAVVGAPRQALRDAVDGRAVAPPTAMPPWVRAAYSEWIRAARREPAPPACCAWSAYP